MKADELYGEIARTASHLASMGWAEANAGNISILLPPGADALEGRTLSEKLPRQVEGLAGRTILVTVSGSRFRNAAVRPERSIVPVKVSLDGCSIERPDGSAPPTSELGTHLMVHALAPGRGQETTALVHTHSTSMLALSSCDLPSELLEDAIRRAHPEISILLPRGVRLLEMMAPGSWDLGEATAKLFGSADCVVWRKHGILGFGGDVDSACDAVEVVEKAARILLQERAAFGRFFGLKDRELEKLP
jgi:rhamnulose-1-phosphate aldolase